MNVKEFRDNLKEHLDAVVRGDEVVVTRGGLDFHVLAVPKGQPLALAFKPPVAPVAPVAPPGSSFDRSELKFCPNGHAMALDGRTCLGKKCKYSVKE